MDKLVQDIEETEKVAHDILSLRSEVVSLDFKRNKNREALRAMSKEAKQPGGCDKTWICVGNMFIKCKTDSATKMIQADQEFLETTINEMRDQIKIQTETLLKLEGKPQPVSLSQLKPLSREDLRGMTGLLPTVSGADFR